MRTRCLKCGVFTFAGRHQSLTVRVRLTARGKTPSVSIRRNSLVAQREIKKDNERDALIRHHERGSFILKGQIRQPGQLLLFPLFPPCVPQTEHQTKSCTCAGSLPSNQFLRSEPFSTGSTSRTDPKHTPTPSPASLPARPATGLTALWETAVFRSHWTCAATHRKERGLVRAPPRKPDICPRVKH